MATRKKSKSEPKKVAKKVREPKVQASKTQQAVSCSISDCVKKTPQNTKEFFSELLAIYGNKYYILLLGAAVGFTAGVVVDHLFIKC